MHGRDLLIIGVTDDKPMYTHNTFKQFFENKRAWNI